MNYICKHKASCQVKHAKIEDEQLKQTQYSKLGHHYSEKHPSFLICLYLINLNKERIISKNKAKGIQCTVPCHKQTDKLLEVLTPEGVSKRQRHAVVRQTSADRISKNDQIQKQLTSPTETLG